MSKSTPTTTVSTKGQVILPKAIRDELKWTEGTRLTVERTDAGVLLKEAAGIPRTNPDDVFGMLKYKGKPKTLKEMDAGVLAEARRRHARSRY
ncbi:MAG TPA: AbrB/MazE/SpoVT family DNA-binding domain-containing protein [Vitreimonas sp.]|uniref:AbrB/MazE/SpoVT family DNA-binding domain-containing protein n=1 Tax=Vitreimonas sp. TaxID=3069702 RepID=UPI002D692CA8|nr:AbrB/MazE/SpoVT family DNA-binding domain-containing protein [Vitreimonas sp.]HYD87648.1 AbrB/MazE/SpoVT family DNA-binding domain-containing protein [Vitreimonas sp.]